MKRFIGTAFLGLTVLATSVRADLFYQDNYAVLYPVKYPAKDRHTHKAKPAPKPDPDPYHTMQRRCAAWARRFDPYYDVYSGYDAEGRFHIHDFGSNAGRFQFNKCMTTNGYPTDLVPDGRQIQ
jgi:hypothetical protein